MEGLNIQYPNQVRKKNKSLPPSLIPHPTLPPRDTKDPSNEPLTATFQRPMSSYKHFDTRICGIPLSSLLCWFLCFQQSMACALRPISQDVQPALKASAPSEAFFPAEGSNCQRLEHGEAISEQEDRGRRKAGGGWKPADWVCHFIICSQVSPLVRPSFPATAPITQRFLAGLPHPELPV